MTTTLRVDSRQVVHDVRITLHNDAPSDGLPDAVIASNDQGLDPGTNWMTLSLYSPLAVEQALVADEPAPLESQVEFGFGVTSMQLAIGPGESTAIDIRLSGPMDFAEGYDLTVFAQPLSKPDEVSWRVVRDDNGSIDAPDGWTERDGAVWLDSLLLKTEKAHFGL